MSNIFMKRNDFTQIRIKVISTSSATTANLNKEVNAAEFKVQKVDNSGLALGTHSEYYNLSTDSGVNSMSGGNGAFSNTVVTAVNSGQITNYHLQFLKSLMYRQLTLNIINSTLKLIKIKMEKVILLYGIVFQTQTMMHRIYIVHRQMM